ncbi:hypothetical protein MPH_12943 [Macrophomina phaseolina MS6]|uniref:Uncharacterized protein n=1 Tax=Macrophomina phaseolina (strain MS6) TaxID=1126212 RepID=K2QJE3_MACPH|nr:hypothetical protein MPH_12943 [Macrophomina phaseolina MS6]
MMHRSEAQINTQDDFSNIELPRLRELHEHGKSVLKYTRAEAQRVACLLSEVNYWMRKFASIMDAHADLVGRHSELLLKHDIAVSRNLGGGQTILDNMMLKRELALYQVPMAEESP